MPKKEKEEKKERKPKLYPMNNRDPVARNVGGGKPLISMFPVCFNDLTGSINSSILLNKIIQWWKNKKRTPFYKYKTKPENPKPYAKGLSWCDELGFTEDEFDWAFRRIGMAVGSSDHLEKIKMISSMLPLWDSKHRLIDSHHLVLCWRDIDRLTWFWLNEEFLLKALHHIGYHINFADKSGKAIEFHAIERCENISLSNYGF